MSVVQTPNMVSFKLTCNVVGCTAPSNTIKYGLCTEHRKGRKTCKIDGCDNGIVESGVCIKHGAERKRKVKLCKVDGCPNKGKGKECLCTSHGGCRYACKVPDCTKYARNKGVCIEHGARIVECAMEGCTKYAVNNGICVKHGAVYPPSCFCDACKTTLLHSTNTSRLCLKCRIRKGEIIEKSERLELQWLSKMIDWGYYPSAHDQIVKGPDCDVLNRRRVDYLFMTPRGFPYNVLVECDENSHSGYDIECEMGRLEQVQDQIMNHTSSLKPLVIVRFNPNHRNQTELENQLKYALRDVFRGTVNISDDRGIVVHSVICYGRKRKALYDNSPITKRILISDK